MNLDTHQTNTTRNRMTNELSIVRERMAWALVGQAVSLVVNPRKIARGIVTDVLAEPDIPQIVVNGMKYSFNQILTHVPAPLNQ